MNAETSPGDETDEIELLRRLRESSELIQAVEQSTGNELSMQRRLRESHSAELVRSAVSLVELRRKAESKFSRAAEMWFDRKGLEQSTSEIVGTYKAKRFASVGEHVTDLCCGIGGDSLALGSAGLHVQAVDLSQLSCLRTLWNCEAYGVQERVETVQADVARLDAAGKLVHFDPDRRPQGSRVIRLEDYHPSLEFMQQLTSKARGGAIKLSPASNFGGKFDGCEIELISHQRECKEATVWFGELQTEMPARATILPDGYTFAADPFDHYPEVSEIKQYLYDPDPAIVRAGLLDALVDHLQIARLDDAEEYLTSASLIDSPALSAFKVIEVLPNNLKEITRFYRRNPIGELEVKCRHVPIHADQFRRKIPRDGDGRGTLFICRLQGKTKAVITERV